MIKFYLLIFLALTGLSLSAQRYERSGNIAVNVGINKDGFNAGVSYEKIVANNNAWVIDADYISRELDTSVSGYNAEIYDLVFSAAFRKYFHAGKIYPFVSAGIFTGYEKLTNKGELQKIMVVGRDSHFLYGLAGHAGIEYNIRSISFMAYVVPRYEFNEKEFIGSFNVGLKYYL